MNQTVKTGFLLHLNHLDHLNEYAVESKLESNEMYTSAYELAKNMTNKGRHIQSAFKLLSCRI